MTDARVGQSDSREQREPDPEPERYGSLALARHRKADGRQLILYRWAPAEPAPGGGTPPYDAQPPRHDQPHG
jgi:hypothetical protein